MEPLVRVPFTWKQGGNHVLLAGTFSGWKGIPMLYNSHTNAWALTVSMVPGSYQFKFIVDGNWFFDPDYPSVQELSGATNNIVLVTTDMTFTSTSTPTPTPSTGTSFDVPSPPLSSLSTLLNSVSDLQSAVEDSFGHILKELGSTQSYGRGQISKFIQVSKNEGYQFSLSCYQFSQSLKKKPDITASLIAQKAKEVVDSFFVRIDQGTGEKDKALVNFSIHTHYLSCASIGEFLLPHSDTSHKIKEDIVVEFSSPNTNKPQHLGHVRNNCLGDAISRMLKYRGYNVHKINLINDRGAHICKSMLAYKKFGHGETPETANKKGDHLVGDYYVVYDIKLSKEYEEWLNTDVAQEEFQKWKVSSSGKRIIEKNERERKKLREKGQGDTEKEKNLPSDYELFKSEYKDYYTNKFSPLGMECNQMLIDWEAGNPSVRELWQMMNGWVFDGFKETYARFRIEHDTWEKESDIYEYGKQIVLECFEKGLFKKDTNGCIVCDLVEFNVLKKGSGEETKKVLLRSNGTSMYMTQDIGTAARRIKLYNNPSKYIYVVACEQDRHFQILFKLLEKLYPESSGHWFHLSYGMVTLPTGRMKSRQGTVVDADNLADELRDMASGVTQDKWPDLTEEENKYRAEVIGMAALKFFILSFGPSTEVTFDPRESLAFSGKAGPYLLYQYARTRSIFKKAGENVANFPFDSSCLSTLGTSQEQDLLVSLLQFPRDVQFACDTLDPSKVVDSIYGICQYFNAWYRLKDKHQVVNCTDATLKKARLHLVMAVANAIKTGLNLLGIETLEQM